MHTAVVWTAFFPAHSGFVLCLYKPSSNNNSNKITFAPIFGVRMCRCNDCVFVIRLFVSPIVSCLLVVGPSVYNCVHFEPLTDSRNFPCRLLISGTCSIYLILLICMTVSCFLKCQNDFCPDI